MAHSFDFDKALEYLQAGKDLTGKDGILMPLIKQLTEAAITAELNHHLSSNEQLNRKNGTSSKTIKTGSGSFELNAARDRAGTFEPQLIKKNQTQLTSEIDRKILSLFSHGMSYRDIKHHIQDMYGIDVSTGALTAVTDQLLPELNAWKERPLESHYPIVWMDAVHYKIKEDGRYIGKAIYTLYA
jgi:putative transposase